MWQPDRFRSRLSLTGAPLLALLLAVIVGPAVIVAPAAAEVESQAAQESADAPRYLLFESAKGELLLGEVTRQDILKRFPDWQEEYEAYEPDATHVARLAAVDQTLQLLCVLGTWCDDSQREVPRFWKLFDEVDNANFSLQMLCVARSADAEQEDELLTSLGFEGNIRATYDVEYVPTFIFSSETDELGRIVESPEESLESDSVSILADLFDPAAAASWR